MSTALSKLNTRAPLDRSPKKNWVENSGGLPMYIRRIANHLHAEKGMTIGHAIATAVNVVKKMCASGDINFPGKQQVNPKSHAEACGAVASWEKKKAGARVSKGIKGRKLSDKEFIEFLIESEETGVIHKGCGCSDEDDHQRNNKRKKKKVPVVEKKFEISDEEFETLVAEIDADRDDLIDFTLEGEVSKSDADKQLVFGWCSVAKTKDGIDVVDKQGDVIEDIEAMEKVAYDFVLHSRDGGEMHVRKGVSALVESFVSTPEKWEALGIPEGVLPIGWWVGFKVNDTEVWKAVKEGKYKMFSVHGTGMRKAYEE